MPTRTSAADLFASSIKRRFFFLILAISGASILAARLWFSSDPRANLDLCEAAALRRDWPEVERVAKRWSQSNPMDDDAWMFRAKAAEATGNWALTVEHLGQINSGGRTYVSAMLKRTDILFNRLHRLNDAIASCRSVINVNPKSCDARRWMVFIRAITMRHSDLLDEIRLSVKNGCASLDAIDYLMRADQLTFANSYELLDRFLETSPDDENCLVARAIIVARGPLPLSSGKTLGDESELHDCLRRFPTNPDLLSVVLEDATKIGDLERVQDLLRKFLAGGKIHDGRYLYYSAWWHFQLDELSLADHETAQSLEFYPCDFRAQQLRAAVLRRLGRAEEAAQMAEIARQGLELKQRIQKLDSAAQITPSLIKQIKNYATTSNDGVLLKLANAFDR